MSIQTPEPADQPDPLDVPPAGLEPGGVEWGERHEATGEIVWSYGRVENQALLRLFAERGVSDGWTVVTREVFYGQPKDFS